MNVGESQYCALHLFCDLLSFVVLGVTKCNKQLYLTLSFTTTFHVVGVRSEDHYRIVQSVHINTHIHSPVHLVIRNDGNNSSNTDAICQAVPEQWPTGESPCLIKETKINGLQLIQHNVHNDSFALTQLRLLCTSG